MLAPSLFMSAWVRLAAPSLSTLIMPSVKSCLVLMMFRLEDRVLDSVLKVSLAASNAVMEASIELVAAHEPPASERLSPPVEPAKPDRVSLESPFASNEIARLSPVPLTRSIFWQRIPATKESTWSTVPVKV